MHLSGVLFAPKYFLRGSPFGASVLWMTPNGGNVGRGSPGSGKTGLGRSPCPLPRSGPWWIGPMIATFGRPGGRPWGPWSAACGPWGLCPRPFFPRPAPAIGLGKGNGRSSRLGGGCPPNSGSACGEIRIIFSLEGPNFAARLTFLSAFRVALSRFGEGEGVLGAFAFGFAPVSAGSPDPAEVLGSYRTVLKRKCVRRHLAWCPPLPGP